jgi:ornithine cyclodeaminase
MRETDDEAISRSSLFCDTRGGALKEGGDYAQPLASGLIKESHVKADLYDLTRGRHRGRASPKEITMFKSVGAAIEDLAAAMLVWKRLG